MSKGTRHYIEVEFIYSEEVVRQAFSAASGQAQEGLQFPHPHDESGVDLAITSPAGLILGVSVVGVADLPAALGVGLGLAVRQLKRLITPLDEGVSPPVRVNATNTTRLIEAMLPGGEGGAPVHHP